MVYEAIRSCSLRASKDGRRGSDGNRNSRDEFVAEHETHVEQDGQAGEQGKAVHGHLQGRPILRRPHGAGATPFPLRATVCGLLAADVASASVAVREPTPPAVKAAGVSPTAPSSN